MINLASTSHLTKWFVWCCDNLPFTVTYDYTDGDKPTIKRRTGAYYVGRGTTLCHIFWATLWVPIASCAAIGLLLFLIGIFHVEAYHSFGKTLGVAAIFVPEYIIAGIAIVVALFVFVIIGADKSGFFKLLRLYLNGIKNKVCPLVKFN